MAARAGHADAHDREIERECVPLCGYCGADTLLFPHASWCRDRRPPEGTPAWRLKRAEHCLWQAGEHASSFMAGVAVSEAIEHLEALGRDDLIARLMDDWHPDIGGVRRALARIMEASNG